MRHRMCGDAQPDARQSPPGKIRDLTGFGERNDERERAGPEGLGEAQSLPAEHSLALRSREIRNMGNQWVEGRAALGGIDRRDGTALRRIGAEGVDRLGREGDRVPRLQEDCGALNAGLVRGEMLGAEPFD